MPRKHGGKVRRGKARGGKSQRGNARGAARSDGDEAAQGRAPLRPFWSGVITFGLVSVPVELYAANRSGGVSLRMVGPDGTPLKRQYWCPAHEREVERDEIVRGYEVEKDRFVVVQDEELEKLEPEKSREIDLTRFVDAAELDPALFQRSYFLAPGGDTTKAYRLLAETMERTGQAGIATFIMRGREYLVAIFSENGILRAETMRFHDELRSPEDVGLPEAGEVEPDRETVALLEDAVGRLEAEALDAGELEDEQAARLEALVERKLRAGKDIAEAPPGLREAEDSEAKVIDILEVLKERMRAAEAGEGGGGRRDRDAHRAGTSDRGGDAGRGGPSELAERTRDELYDRAKELDIPGRSRMTKDELVRAIRRAS